MIANQSPKKNPSWWFQPIWNILVKVDHLPKYRGKINNIWNHHLVSLLSVLLPKLPHWPCGIRGFRWNLWRPKSYRLHQVLPQFITIAWRIRWSFFPSRVHDWYGIFTKMKTHRNPTKCKVNIGVPWILLKIGGSATFLAIFGMWLCWYDPTLSSKSQKKETYIHITERVSFKL